MAEGDLLYHSIHGLCRLDKVMTHHDGREGTFYSLIPHAFKKGNLRFVFAMNDMESTGFHQLVSVADAYAILGYFKKGISDLIPMPAPTVIRSFSDDNQTWALAKILLTCAHNDMEAKDQRRRQTLKRAARGLLLELSFVLQLPLSEMIFQVRKNLESTGKLNPLVVSALNDANQE